MQMSKVAVAAGTRMLNLTGNLPLLLSTRRAVHLGEPPPPPRPQIWDYSVGSTALPDSEATDWQDVSCISGELEVVWRASF